MDASSFSSSSSSVGVTAHCGLWPVKQCLSIFPYLSPTLCIFSLPALEDVSQTATVTRNILFGLDIGHRLCSLWCRKCIVTKLKFRQTLVFNVKSCLPYSRDHKCRVITCWFICSSLAQKLDKIEKNRHFGSGGSPVSAVTQVVSSRLQQPRRLLERFILHSITAKQNDMLHTML